MLLFTIISALLIWIDLFTKRLAVTYLAAGQEIQVIPGFLRFIYVENTGAAFGILPGARWFLALVALVVSVIIIWYIMTERCRSRVQFFGFVFVFPGAIGNFINRIMLGYVVDFINLPNWPTFNFADIFINIGVVLLIIYILFYSGKEEQAHL